MTRRQLPIFILIWILCNAILCERPPESDGSKVFILAKVDPYKVTYHVGDTLTIEMQVPDNTIIVDGQDTIGTPITNFANFRVDYTFNRIDTSQAENLDQSNLYIESKQLEGGTLGDMTFTDS
ncbi:MAG: hypothetical protein ABIV51_01015 [Saprospiraceae bacterium]